MTDPRNFLLNGDYPIDKVIYLKEGSFLKQSDGIGGIESAVFHEFNHELSFAPLISGTWSFDSDFNHSRDFFLPGSYIINSQWLSCESTNEKIIFDFRDWVANSPSVPVYYRIYGFLPSDASIETALTATSSVSTNKFIFNTDFNYSKLFQAGHFTVPSDGRATHRHGLGFIPQVELWEERYDTYFKQFFIRPLNESLFAQITDNHLIIAPILQDYFHATLADKKIYYRIYADGF
jgi:hypothetical protein